MAWSCFRESSGHPYETDTIIIILQVGKLRNKEIKELAQDHTAREKLRWDLRPSHLSSVTAKRGDGGGDASSWASAEQNWPNEGSALEHGAHDFEGKLVCQWFIFPGHLNLQSLSSLLDQVGRHLISHPNGPKHQLDNFWSGCFYF